MAVCPHPHPHPDKPHHLNICSTMYVTCVSFPLPLLFPTSTLLPIPHLLPSPRRGTGWGRRRVLFLPWFVLYLWPTSPLCLWEGGEERAYPTPLGLGPAPPHATPPCPLCLPAHCAPPTTTLPANPHLPTPGGRDCLPHLTPTPHSYHLTPTQRRRRPPLGLGGGGGGGGCGACLTCLPSPRRRRRREGQTLPILLLLWLTYSTYHITLYIILTLVFFL